MDELKKQLDLALHKRGDLMTVRDDIDVQLTTVVSQIADIRRAMAAQPKPVAELPVVDAKPKRR